MAQSTIRMQFPNGPKKRNQLLHFTSLLIESGKSTCIREAQCIHLTPKNMVMRMTKSLKAEIYMFKSQAEDANLKNANAEITSVNFILD
jgi:hypothetical protein